MTVAHRLRPFAPTLLSAGTPYVERADHRENRLDTLLLNAWGSASPYLLSRLERKQLERFVQRVEDQENLLTGLRDEQLRPTADALRGRLLSTSLDTDQIASSLSVDIEAVRRHEGRRTFTVQ